jgi:DNA polymerase-3 subunit epsilon
MREIVLDIESTGLNTQKDRIIEIACLELFDKQPTGESIQVYINPQSDISEEATRIHGITNEMLLDKPIFSQCWYDIEKFIGESPIVAHNSSFDIGMITSELIRIGKKPLTNEIIDTLALARKKFAMNNSLDGLAKRYKIKAERRLHGALKDCYILASVYYFLAITELQIESVEIESEEGEFSFPRRINPSKISQEEILAHENMIKVYNINF